MGLLNPTPRDPDNPGRPKKPSWVPEGYRLSTAAPTQAFVRPGQVATGLRKPTPEELAIRDAYEAYNEARNRRVIGDDIGASPRALFDVAYRHGIKYPAESMQRTVTGTNAASYLDPRGGLRAGERLAGIGEDVLNIASIVPFARAGVAALEAPLMARAVTRGIAQGEAADLALRQQWQAYDDVYAAYKAREAAWRSSPEGMAAEAKDKAAYEARHGNKGPFPPRPPAKYPGYSEYPKRPAQPRPVNRPSRSELYDLAKQQRDLAYKKLDYSIPPARMPEPPLPADPENTVRVWHTSPQGQRLPSSLNPISDYADESTFFTERRGSPQGNLLSSGLYTTESQVISGSYGQPTRMTHSTGYEKFGSYIPEPDQRKLILSEEAEIRARRRDINSPISSFEELRINNSGDSNLLRRGRFAKPTSVTFAPPGIPEAEIIDESDLDISRWNFGGKNPSEITIKDLINAAPNEQAARAVIMALGDPIVSTSGRTTLKYPLWRQPGTADPTRFAMTSKDVPGYLIENQPFLPHDYDLKGARSELYVRGEDGVVRTFIPERYGPGRSANTLPGLFDRGTPSGRPIISETPPGQNYFDLPITRNPDGSIATVGGMKAYDIGGTYSPERAAEISDSTRRFLQSLSPNGQISSNAGLPLNAPNEIEGIAAMLSAQPLSKEEALRNWRTVQAVIERMFPGGKQKWYQWLRDDLGIEVLPHPGGVTMGDTYHQAYVFNSPEKLPPSGYAATEAIDPDQIYAQRMNDYTNALVKVDRYRPRASVPYRLPPSRPAADFLNQAFAGYMANAMRPRPQNRNSPR